MISPVATDLGLRWLRTAVGQAPSVFNTQPWRVAARHGTSVELLADPDRRLRVSDPRGRSLTVSCGAALFNLRLAVRVAGHRPVIGLLPNPQRGSRLLAVVRTVEVGPPTAETRHLYEHIGVRRTNREPFTDRHVPHEVLTQLRVAASLEGATLITLGRFGAATLLEHVALAEEALAADDDYQAELRAWTMPGHHYDGMPPYVLGLRSADDPAPVRDFGAHASDDAVHFEPHPQLAVLTTKGDSPIDWLRAGQALQRVLLTAIGYGVSASFLNQPLDLRDMRRRRDPHHRRGHIQMIIRLGYGPPVPRAPRRPARELDVLPA